MGVVCPMKMGSGWLNRGIEPGGYIIKIDASFTDIRLCKPITLTGKERKMADGCSVFFCEK